MTKKKSKAVMLDSVPIKPISAAEHRRIDRQIKKKYEKLRKQYYEIHGKKVDWISHSIEEGVMNPSKLDMRGLGKLYSLPV